MGTGENNGKLLKIELARCKCKMRPFLCTTFPSLLRIRARARMLHLTTMGVISGG